MEILEAYDLTGSLRAAAGLVGRDHKRSRIGCVSVTRLAGCRWWSGRGSRCSPGRSMSWSTARAGRSDRDQLPMRDVRPGSTPKTNTARTRAIYQIGTRSGFRIRRDPPSGTACPTLRSEERPMDDVRVRPSRGRSSCLQSRLRTRDLPVLPDLTRCGPLIPMLTGRGLRRVAGGWWLRGLVRCGGERWRGRVGASRGGVAFVCGELAWI